MLKTSRQNAALSIKTNNRIHPKDQWISRDYQQCYQDHKKMPEIINSSSIHYKADLSILMSIIKNILYFYCKTVMPFERKARKNTFT